MASRNWFLVEYLTILIEFLLMFGLSYNRTSLLRRDWMTFLVSSFFNLFYCPQSIRFFTASIWYFLVASSTAPSDKACFLCYANFLLFSLILGLKSMPLFCWCSMDFLRFNSSLFFSRSRFNYDEEALFYTNLCVFFDKMGLDCIFESSDRWFDIFSFKTLWDFLWWIEDKLDISEDLRRADDENGCFAEAFFLGLESVFVFAYTAASSSVSFDIAAFGVLFLAPDPFKSFDFVKDGALGGLTTIFFGDFRFFIVVSYPVPPIDPSLFSHSSFSVSLKLKCFASFWLSSSLSAWKLWLRIDIATGLASCDPLSQLDFRCWIGVYEFLWEELW